MLRIRVILINFNNYIEYNNRVNLRLINYPFKL